MELTSYFLSWAFLAQLFYVVTARNKYVFQTRIEKQETYDFVIVGGGTSGLTVADRLTEDPDITVLVIEYGIFDQKEDFLTTPGLASTGDLDKYVETMETEPIRGLNNQPFEMLFPALVGGATAINGMLYDRGSAEDFDAWVELGNPGWGWKDLLPYFKKTETFTPVPEPLAKDFNVTWDTSAHGTSGPVQSSMPSFIWPDTKNFVHAWNSLGIPNNLDSANGFGTGVAWTPFMVDPTTETRSSARTAHYDNIAPNRSNYHFLTSKAVNKVLFEGKRAVGVQYVDRDTGVISVVRAGKEVVMAAGVIHTPQILQLSGVGPGQLLGGLGIEVVVDLPVGYNFQDHPEMGHEFNFTSRPIPNSDMLLTNTTYSNEQKDLYKTSHKGAYTLSTFGFNAFACLSLSQITSTYRTIISKIQSQDASTAYPSNTPITSAISKGYDLQRQVISKLYASNSTPIMAFGGLETEGTSAFWLFTPLSRGTVFINTTNIFTQPQINNNAFGLETDLDIFTVSLRKSREAFSTPSMMEMGPTETSPGADLKSDDEIAKAIAGNAYPGGKHMCCTAPMMARVNGGVVDGELLVYGVEGLRIVDASVFPIVGTTSGSSTVYAVAEKAADLIKKKYSIPHNEI